MPQIRVINVKNAGDSWYVVLLLSGLLILAMMYHWVLPLNGVLFTEGPQGHDFGQMAWNLWFAEDAILKGHNPYHADLLYYPLGVNLSHHTLSPGFFPVTFLIRVISRGEPLYPIYAYHVVIFLCFLLMLACSFFLLRELAFTRLACATAAFAYALGDFYQQHILHLNLIAGFFIPLTALFLVLAYKKPRSPNIVYAAFVSACSVHFTEFALYIYISAFLFWLLMLLFKEERRRLTEVLRAMGWKRVLLAVAIFVLVIMPFATNFTRGNVVKPALIESSVYSANLASFFIPGPQHALLTKIFGNLEAQITVGVSGLEAFLGFTLIVFGLVGLLMTRQKLVLCAGMNALVFYVLCLGPSLKLFGSDTAVPLPYALLVRVPPFAMGRTPVRFLSIATFFLMLVAASGLSLIQYALAKRWGAGRSAAAMLILFALTVVEAYTPTPRRHVFVLSQKLSESVAGPVFNVPLREFDGFASLMQVFHRQPIATGAVARSSVESSERFQQMKQLYDRGGPEFCERVATMGFENIIVIPGEVTVPLELSRCRIRVIDLRTDSAWLASFPGGITSDEPQFPDYAYGTRIGFGRTAADPYLWYGWSGREPFSHWTDRGKAAITFSLDAVRTSVLRLKMAPFLAPPGLASQQVEVKLNERWIANPKLTQQEPAEYSFELPAGALRKHNVLSFDLPDAQSPKAMGVSDDIRLLGINVQWMQIDLRN